MKILLEMVEIPVITREGMGMIEGKLLPPGPDRTERQNPDQNITGFKFISLE
jgi:hypothetical protein